MNIAYILNDTPVNGGATKAFVNMLEGLKTYDVKSFVVVPNRQGIYIELKKQGIPVLATPFRPCTYPYSNTLQQKLFFTPRLAARIIVNGMATRKLERFLKENKIDLVHSNTGVVRIGYDAAKRLGIPHIYHIREFAELIGYHYYPRKSAFQKQLETCYSICITKAVEAHYHLTDAKRMNRVVYDGVFNTIHTKPTSLNKGYFLYAGRIQPVKGLDLLLEAYKNYKEHVVEVLPLKVAGSNDDIAYYNQQIRYVKKNGLLDHVHFLGDRNDIATLMRDARALIIPSRSEGFGFCMPEAMFQGCLAIGRNIAGTKEQFDNGLRVTGKEIGLRYETTEELASLLAEVSSRPADYYRPYTERAFNVVNQLYTQESNAQQVYTFYQDILKENK